MLQKLLFFVPLDGLWSENLMLQHKLLWTVAEGSCRKFFFPFVGMLQESVLRFLMFSQENQYLHCVRYFLEELKWLIVIFLFIFIIWLAVNRRNFCCVTESEINNCYFLSLCIPCLPGRHLCSKAGVLFTRSIGRLSAPCLWFQSVVLSAV